MTGLHVCVARIVVFVPLGDRSLQYTMTEFLNILQSGVYEMKPKEQIDLRNIVKLSLADCIYKSGMMSIVCSRNS